MEVGPDQPLSASVADALLAGDEDETGPPDVQSLGTRGVVRLGVSPDDVVLEADQTVLASSTGVHGGAGEAIPKLTEVTARLPSNLGRRS